MENETEFWWIPEDVLGGRYAHKHQVHQMTTYNVQFALRFKTREECQRWCNLNRTIHFLPVEHGFMK